MRILLYVSHQQTLGEVQRALSIAEHLFINHTVLIINAGASMPLLQKCVSLPFPLYDANSLRYGTYNTRTPEQKTARAKSLLNTCLTFQPELFITTGFPFHFAEEYTTLMPVLKSLSCPAWCSLGYPLSTTPQSMQHKTLARFEKILVHCPEDLDPLWIDPAQNLPLTKLLVEWQHAGRCVFTNYILPRESLDAVHETPLQEQDYILVSRGSGTVCDNILTVARSAAELLGKKIILVEGIMNGKNEQSVHPVKNAEVNNNSFTHLSQADFTVCLRRAACSVSMAGYGTAVQLLFTRQTKAVLIPKPHVIDTEQDYRARMLCHILGAEVLEYDQLTPQSLSTAIQKVMSSATTSSVNKPVISESWFSGLSRISREINGCSHRTTAN